MFYCTQALSSCSTVFAVVDLVPFFKFACRPRLKNESNPLLLLRDKGFIGSERIGRHVCMPTYPIKTKIKL